MFERWSIMVHGGARTVPAAQAQANRDGCLAALRAGASILTGGGSAVDAVVAAIRVLEDDPAFNAGRGAVRNAEGEVELDAALIDGDTLDVGAVAALRAVRHPIDAAHALLRDTPVLLVGEGAARYAAEHGVPPCRPEELLVDGIEAPGCDTVGCVAFDIRGALAAGASTGGLAGVRPGRVGDAPIPGCGLAAETQVGAVAFSGDGESILRLTLAGRVMRGLAEVTPGVAAQQAIAQLHRVGGEAGCIVLDGHGVPGVAHNSDHFAFGFASADRRAQAFLHSGEFTDGR